MSDAEIRQLERAHAEAPDDHVALERLQDARVRRGLGWRGEKLPENEQGHLVPGDERGVYVWRCGDLAIELVYVPEGEVKCDHWLAPGSRTFMDDVADVAITTPEQGVLHYNLASAAGCPSCVGTDTIKTEPFYIGRFPVTWGEFEGYCRAVEPRRDNRVLMYHYPPKPNYATEHHPVANTDPHGLVDQDGRKPIPSFLVWSGLRLPNRFEWLWAALGPPDQDWHLLPPHYVSGSTNPGVYLCQKCGKPCFGLASKCDVISPRAYPWGCESPRSARATGIWALMAVPSQCVFDVDQPAPVLVKDTSNESEIQSLLHAKQQMVGSLYPSIIDDKIEKLRAQRGLVPARPDGRSWRGAFDMAGNVFELVDNWLALGGSFRSTDMSSWPRVTGPVREPRDDIGFRVAVSAAS